MRIYVKESTLRPPFVNVTYLHIHFCFFLSEFTTLEGQAVVHLVQTVRQQHAFTFATLDIWRAEDVSFRLSEWKVINTGRTHDKLLQCAQWGEILF